MPQSKLLFLVVLLYLQQQVTSQFPSKCNHWVNLRDKSCCPYNCNAAKGRGHCRDITSKATSQANTADKSIVEILRNASNVPQKGKIDSRYRWPTMVFERVCLCNDKFYGADCSECKSGWTGENCEIKVNPPIARKHFSHLSEQEKQDVVNGLRMLKNETGYWSVIINEPESSSGRVTLKNVSTYDYLVYIHNYVSRDASKDCTKVNHGISIDFAHSGPNFPIWHRTYMLVLERAMQRVLKKDNLKMFRFPYWSWESNDTSLFTAQYFGSLSSSQGRKEIVTDGLLEDWNTVCDVTYRKGNYFGDNDPNLCSTYRAPCNPMADLAQNRKLERGKAETYIPSLREVQMAIAAPKYDVPNGETHKYQRDGPRDSFRTRLEGWSLICSASNCIQPQVSNAYQRMHNVIHDWIGGHMGVPPSAVNDPIFSLHHCNVDRILESWMRKFHSLPQYVPTSGGHPGHNKNDYMVPFFPLITPGDQYSLAENWGYTYDNIIQATIRDKDITTCANFNNETISQCYICTAESIDCHCYNNSYVPCMQCPATSKNYCSLGSSSSMLKANVHLFLLVGLLSIMPSYFSL